MGFDIYSGLRFNYVNLGNKYRRWGKPEEWRPEMGFGPRVPG